VVELEQPVLDNEEQYGFELLPGGDFLLVYRLDEQVLISDEYFLIAA
jgi:hypothetical protein